MKKLICVGGSMGVGKTTVCQKLKSELDHSVFLDGDWCWNMNPFIVNDETKEMVMNNIVFQLNSFIHCSCFDYVIFGWVMHEQGIIDDLMSRLDLKDIDVLQVSLVCDEEKLKKQLEKDIHLGIREPDILERSLERLACYEELSTLKIDTTSLSVEETVQRLKELIKQ